MNSDSLGSFVILRDNFQPKKTEAIKAPVKIGKKKNNLKKSFNQ